MSAETIVYQHDFSVDIDDRPEWVGMAPRLYIDEFLVQGRPKSEYLPRHYASPPGVNVHHDYFPTEGTNGLFSKRLVDAIKPYLFPSFSLLPETLDNSPYYFFRRENSIDCLDTAKSDVTFFVTNPHKILSVKKYSFHEERLNTPLIFGIPGLLSEIFWTKDVVELCEDAGFTGIRFISIDRVNNNGGRIPPFWISEKDSTEDS